MKLSKKELVLICFMLFSLFFGAGNLIFPPFLGQSAGNMMPIAIAGFLLTAVILPVLGVVVVAKGASDSKVKHNIEVAVSNLYNLDANKVNVYSMK